MINIPVTRAPPRQIPVAFWGTALIALSVALWASSFIIGFQSALTLLTLLGYSAALIGLRQPALGLLGIGMLCTLDPLTSNLLLTGGLLRWNTFNYCMLIVMLLHIPFLLRLSDLHTRLAQLLILLLGLELGVSLDASRGIEVVLNAATQFGVLVYFARAQADARNWHWLALSNGVLAAVGGAVFYIQQDQLPYVNPNMWSFFPLTALFAICFSFAVPSQMRRLAFVRMPLAMFSAVWIFLTGSRGSMLIAVACLLYLLMQLRGIWQWTLVVALAGLVAVTTAVQFPNLQTQAVGRLALLTDSNSSLVHRTSGRSNLVVGGWYIFRANPLGVGTGGFPRAWSRLDNLEGLGNFQRGVEFPAHATWIKILAENGVPGGLLLGAYVLSFTLVGWRQGLPALGLLVCGSLVIAFTTVEFQWARGIWFLAAGATVLLNREQIAAHWQGAMQRTPIANIARAERNEA